MLASNNPAQPEPRNAVSASPAPLPAQRKKRASSYGRTDTGKKAPPPAIQPPARKPDVFQAGWRELTDDDYHADPCPAPSLSSHVAMLIIQKSLAHAWRAHPRAPEYARSPSTGPQDMGSAAHALILGGRPIMRITADDYRTQAARQARDDARAAGRIPILEKDLATLEAMAGPARERLCSLHGGAFLSERSALWRAPKGGWRRARIDTVSCDHRVIVDYKTTEANVDAASCERRIADMGLQIQAAAYIDAIETLEPDLRGRVRFIFQWQEQKAPYALSPPIEMSEAFLSLGRAQWRAAGRLWDQALRHKAFPGYSARPHLACPPPWELSRWEERVARDELSGELR
jgi:hypothetical protein